MIDALSSQPLLKAFRGEAEVSRSHLVDLLVGLGRLAIERPDVISVDVNPLIVDATGIPVAVDALVEIDHRHQSAQTERASRPRPSDAAFKALFEPRGVVVTGASSHPGKFGFVSLHNLLAAGYAGDSKFTPWRLVTYVAFSDQAKATAFERYLKSGSGHAFARKRLW